MIDASLEKHLETSKAILVFERGTDEDKLRFCKEYLIKYMNPVKKTSPDTVIKDIVQDIIPMNGAFEISKDHEIMLDPPTYRNFFESSVRNVVQSATNEILQNSYISERDDFANFSKKFHIRFYMAKMRQSPHSYTPITSFTLNSKLK